MSVRPSVSRITGGLLAGFFAATLLATACSSEPDSKRNAGQDAGAGAGGTAAAGGAGGASGGSAGQAQLCGNGQVDPGETCDESASIGTDAGAASSAGASGGGSAGASGGGSGGSGGNTSGGSGGSGSTDAGASGASGGSGGDASAGNATGGSGGSGSTDAGALEVGRCVSLASCPPPSACMRTVLTGSVATCDVACAEAPVACAHGDGCCAPGCAPSEDDDCAVWACDPSAPLGGAAYAGMESLSKDALRSALRGFVAGHTALGYDSARDYMFNTLDVHEGNIECVYTGRVVPADGTRIPGGFNTEHSWPQSDGASSAPANSDLHHLFPTDGFANGERGNWPFGETVCEGAACQFAQGGSELGKDTGGHTVFQVRQLRQGDIARAHFYFSIRYNLPIDAAEEATLRAWHCGDPPDDFERSRNDGIEAQQHNRNPFVDRPDFAQRLLDF